MSVLKKIHMLCDSYKKNGEKTCGKQNKNLFSQLRNQTISNTKCQQVTSEPELVYKYHKAAKTVLVFVRTNILNDYMLDFSGAQQMFIFT